jgi:hypothetical protein
MGIRDDLAAESVARNRRFIIAALITLAGLPTMFVLKSLVPPGSIPKAGVIAISLIFPLGFLAYMIWDFEVRPRRLGQRCPVCGQALTGYALRAAMDTSRCVRCGRELG